MKDTEIVKLYFARTEEAIEETARKYGSYLFSIAFHILDNPDDAEEIVNDSYRAAWDRIPPENPSVLRHYLSRITRNLALKRLEYNTAGKRSCKGSAALEELEDCIPDRRNVEDAVEAKELGTIINRFLSELPKEDAAVFLLRYYYALPIRDIAARCNLSERTVKYRLSRLRTALKDLLKKEGY